MVVAGDTLSKISKHAYGDAGKYMKIFNAVFEEFKGRNLPEILVTTDHVVSETITLTRYRISHERAVFVGEWLYSEKTARIHRATFEEQRAAFDCFKRHADKKYSTVDCLSFVVMESHGIREALAVDEDFTHRFVARPGPRPKR